jgi:hypothetical protein
MTLGTDECIELYVFLKRREGELSPKLEKIMTGCEKYAYDHFSAAELEKLLEVTGGDAE